MKTADFMLNKLVNQQSKLKKTYGLHSDCSETSRTISNQLLKNTQ